MIVAPSKVDELGVYAPEVTGEFLPSSDRGPAMSKDAIVASENAIPAGCRVIANGEYLLINKDVGLNRVDTSAIVYIQPGIPSVADERVVDDRHIFTVVEQREMIVVQ